jgi:hypothetical protein
VTQRRDFAYILDLQAAAGNRAVAQLLEPRATSREPSTGVIQRTHTTFFLTDKDDWKWLQELLLARKITEPSGGKPEHKAQLFVGYLERCDRDLHLRGKLSKRAAGGAQAPLDGSDIRLLTKRYSAAFRNEGFDETASEARALRAVKTFRERLALMQSLSDETWKHREEAMAAVEGAPQEEVADEDFDEAVPESPGEAVGGSDAPQPPNIASFTFEAGDGSITAKGFSVSGPTAPGRATVVVKSPSPSAEASSSTSGGKDVGATEITTVGDRGYFNPMKEMLVWWVRNGIRHEKIRSAVHDSEAKIVEWLTRFLIERLQAVEDAKLAAERNEGWELLGKPVVVDRSNAASFLPGGSKLVLYSQRVVCESCQDVLQEFANLWDGKISLNVVGEFIVDKGADEAFAAAKAAQPPVSQTTTQEPRKPGPVGSTEAAPRKKKKKKKKKVPVATP